MILFLLRFFPPFCLAGTANSRRTFPKEHRMCVLIYPQTYGLGYYSIIIFILQQFKEKKLRILHFFRFSAKKHRGKPSGQIRATRGMQITDYFNIFPRKLCPIVSKPTPRYSEIVAAIAEYVRPTPRSVGTTLFPKTRRGTYSRV